MIEPMMKARPARKKWRSRTARRRPGSGPGRSSRSRSASAATRSGVAGVAARRSPPLRARRSGRPRGARGGASRLRVYVRDEGDGVRSTTSVRSIHGQCPASWSSTTSALGRRAAKSRPNAIRMKGSSAPQSDERRTADSLEPRHRPRRARTGPRAVEGEDRPAIAGSLTCSQTMSTKSVGIGLRPGRAWRRESATRRLRRGREEELAGAPGPPDPRDAVPAVAGHDRHGVHDDEALQPLGLREGGDSASTPQSWTTRL